MREVKVYRDDGSVIESISKELILGRLEQLEFKNNRELIISRSSKGSIIKIEITQFRRFHIYRSGINNPKQTKQPLPKSIFLDIISKYLDGDLNWYKGAKFINAEPEGYIKPEKEITLQEIDDEELDYTTRGTVIFGIVALLASIVSFIYMYGRWDNMWDMNEKFFFLLMGIIIGGPVYFIYSIFDFYEQIKEKKRRK